MWGQRYINHNHTYNHKLDWKKEVFFYDRSFEPIEGEYLKVGAHINEILGVMDKQGFEKSEVDIYMLAEHFRRYYYVVCKTSDEQARFKLTMIAYSSDKQLN
jgi:hypothetical protein